jgi:hypothetical protein
MLPASREKVKTVRFRKDYVFKKDYFLTGPESYLSNLHYKQTNSSLLSNSAQNHSRARPGFTFAHLEVSEAHHPDVLEAHPRVNGGHWRCVWNHRRLPSKQKSYRQLAVVKPQLRGFKVHFRVGAAHLGVTETHPGDKDASGFSPWLRRITPKAILFREESH